jgi:hypothetical protein
VAAALATLVTDERAWGQAWHAPSTICSQREALTGPAAAMGAPPARVSGIPWPLFARAGADHSVLRAVVSVRHQLDAPYVLGADTR